MKKNGRPKGRPQTSNIIIFVFIFYEAENCDRKSKNFRNYHRPPNPIDFQKNRKDHNRGDLENNGSEERNNGGNKPVVKGGEKSGTENVDSANEECK